LVVHFDTPAMMEGGPPYLLSRKAVESADDYQGGPER
jgi:hypothetical protein